MAHYGLLADDLKSEIDKLPETDREALKLALTDMFFVFNQHGRTLERIFTDSTIENLRKTMTPHLQALAADAMFGGGIDWSALFVALIETFPEFEPK
jgi:hypothetical protein